MDAGFWHSRWEASRIGFHQAQPTPMLLDHWAALRLAPGRRVFVPLCGKSLDMAWLAAQGLQVLGVELSPLAVQAFFAEQGLVAEISTSRYGVHHRAGPIEIVVGDAFALDAGALSDCDAVFDRAALIALPPDLRRRYADELYARLPRGCRGLLITLDYPQREKAGPPFSVPQDEVHALFGRDWAIERIDRRDILGDQPSFRDEGVTALATEAYRLLRR